MIPSNYYESTSSTNLVGLREQELARADAQAAHMVGSGTKAPRLSNAHVTELGEKPILIGQEPTATLPQVSRLARRVHGWSWQAVGFHFIGQSGIIVLCLISSTVPRRHGHWCCLCYPVRLEAASTISDDH